MSNPVFSSNPVFKQGAQQTTPAGYPTMPGYTPGHPNQGGYGAPYGQNAYGQNAYDQNAYGQTGYADPYNQAQLEQQYAAPAASAVETGRMTYDDVIVRTAALLLTVVITAAFGWYLVANAYQAQSAQAMGTAVMVTSTGAVGALIFGLINTFKREPSPVLMFIYALAEGLMLGGFSAAVEITRYSGIVLQAVLGTLATFVVMLCLYKFANFRLQGKFLKIFMIALIGYGAFAMVNFLLQLTGLVGGEFGLYSMTVAGIPLGLIIGPIAVIMAAVSLVLDFQNTESLVNAGAPRRYAWTCAFGLVVTLVWLYIEILRLLAIFSSDD